MIGQGCGWNSVLCSAAMAATVVLQAAADAGGPPCAYDVAVIQGPVHPIFGPAVTTVTGLNELGQVVGFWYFLGIETSQGFIWTAEEGMTTLTPPPGTSAILPADINDHGVIVGQLTLSGFGFRGFVYEDGDWTILEPVVAGSFGWSWASAINNAGVVVGGRSIGSPGDPVNPYNAFIWSADTGFTDLGLMHGYSNSARDVNEAGDVAGSIGTGGTGSTAWLFSKGELTFLGPIPGGSSSTANAASPQGAVVGSGWVLPSPPTPAFGYFWLDGKFQLIDPLPAYDTSGAGDMNSLGQLVGLCGKLSSPNDKRAYVWYEGQTYDLNERIAAPPNILWMHLSSAGEIDETGRIIANGESDGGVTGFLLAPTTTGIPDLTGECVVDGLDLGILLSNWSIPPQSPGCGGQLPCPSDINGDGFVNGLDLGILLANWTFQ